MWEVLPRMLDHGHPPRLPWGKLRIPELRNHAGLGENPPGLPWGLLGFSAIPAWEMDLNLSGANPEDQRGEQPAPIAGNLTNPGARPRDWGFRGESHWIIYFLWQR